MEDEHGEYASAGSTWAVSGPNRYWSACGENPGVSKAGPQHSEYPGNGRADDRKLSSADGYKRQCDEKGFDPSTDASIFIQ